MVQMTDMAKIQMLYTVFKPYIKHSRPQEDCCYDSEHMMKGILETAAHSLTSSQTADLPLSYFCPPSICNSIRIVTKLNLVLGLVSPLVGTSLVPGVDDFASQSS